MPFDPKSMSRKKGLAKAAKAASSAPVSDIQKVLAARGGEAGAEVAKSTVMSQGATTVVAITALAAGFVGAYGWQQSTESHRTGDSLISQELLMPVDEGTETIVVEATAALDSLDVAYQSLRRAVEELSRSGPRARALASETLYAAWLAFVATDVVEELGRSISEKQGVITRLAMAVDNERVLRPPRVRRDALDVRGWARRNLSRCDAAVRHLDELSARADAYSGALPHETVAERMQREAAQDARRELIERRERADGPDLTPPIRVR